MYTDEQFRKEFGKRLKARRIAAGYENQKDFAKAADVSAQALCYYESGDRLPDIFVVYRLAKAAGCSTDFLAGIDKAGTHDETFICEQTGLSGEAVELLCERKTLGDPDSRHKYGFQKLISDLICDSGSEGIGDRYVDWIEYETKAHEEWNASLIKAFDNMQNIESNDIKEKRRIDMANKRMEKAYTISNGARYVFVTALETFLCDISDCIWSNVSNER